MVGELRWWVGGEYTDFFHPVCTLIQGFSYWLNCKFDNGGCEIYRQIPTFSTQYPPASGAGIAKMVIFVTSYAKATAVKGSLPHCRLSPGYPADRVPIR